MHLFIHSKTNNQEMTSFCCLYAILRHFHYKHDLACMMEDLQGQPFNFANFIKLLDLYRVEYQYCDDCQEILKRKGSIFLIHTVNGSVLYMGNMLNYTFYMDPLRGYCIKKKNDFFNMQILDIIDISFIGRYPFYHQSLTKLYEPFKLFFLKTLLIFLVMSICYLVLDPLLKLVFFYICLLFSFYQISKMFYLALDCNVEDKNEDFIGLLKLYREGIGPRILFMSLCFFEFLGLVLYERSFIALYIIQQLFCVMEWFFLYQNNTFNISMCDMQLQKVQVLDHLKYVAKYPLKAYVKYSLVFLHFLCLIIYYKYPLYLFIHLIIMIVFGIYKSYLLSQLAVVKSHEQDFYMKQYETQKYTPLTKIESVKLYDYPKWQTLDYFYLYKGNRLFLDAEQLKINDVFTKKYAPSKINQTIAYYQSFHLPLDKSPLEYLNEEQIDILFYLLPVFKINLLYKKIGELEKPYQSLIGFVRAYTKGEKIIFFDHCLREENIESIATFVNEKKDKIIIVAYENKF